MGKVRLYLDNVAELAGNSDIALVALADEIKMLMVSIVCERSLGTALKMRMQNEPITKILLPEVAAQMLRASGNANYELLINGINEGQYKAYVHNVDTEDMFRIRISDGLMLATAMDMPIYMDERLMDKQAVPYRTLDKGVSVPVNIITVPMLEESLKKAIETENYEMAAKLHHELERRKNDNKNEEL